MRDRVRQKGKSIKKIKKNIQDLAFLPDHPQKQETTFLPNINCKSINNYIFIALPFETHW